MAGSHLTASEEIRRRAAARLMEKLDPARNRHKPLSLLRVEARRLIEPFYDAEAPHMPKTERDKLIDDLVAEVLGLGPLDELFRDEAVAEFMVLAHNQIISRKGGHWLPTSVQFRSPEQYRETLLKLVQHGAAIGEQTPHADGGFDVILPNGFRLLTVLPPEVLDVAPLAVFHRGKAATQSGVVSGTTRVPARTVQDSGAIANNPRPAGSGPTSAPSTDPIERLRLKITERLILRLAANGVYDLRAIPDAELQRVIALYVAEFVEAEKLTLDAATQDRLTREILTAMNR